MLVLVLVLVLVVVVVVVVVVLVVAAAGVVLSLFFARLILMSVRSASRNNAGMVVAGSFGLHCNL